MKNRLKQVKSDLHGRHILVTRDAHKSSFSLVSLNDSSYLLPAAQQIWAEETGRKLSRDDVADMFVSFSVTHYVHWHQSQKMETWYAALLRLRSSEHTK